MALIVKALRVPAFPPIVPIPTLPLNTDKEVIAIEVATPNNEYLHMLMIYLDYYSVLHRNHY
jgi:hypothetical protein